MHPACTWASFYGCPLSTVSSSAPPPPSWQPSRAQGFWHESALPSVPPGAQTLGVLLTTSNRRSPQKSHNVASGQGEPWKHLNLPKPLPVLGRRTPRHPWLLQLPSGCWDRVAAWEPEASGGPSVPALTPGGGLAISGWLLPPCQSCLQPRSFFHPTGSTELHPSPSLQAGSPCRHLL